MIAVWAWARRQDAEGRSAVGGSRPDASGATVPGGEVDAACIRVEQDLFAVQTVAVGRVVRAPHLLSVVGRPP